MRAGAFMAGLRRTGVLGALAALAALALPAVAGAQEGKPPGAWVRGVHADVRLIAADSALGADGSVLAGIEFRPEDGWKTYWRHPGAAGIAPDLDWSASRNLARVEVLWPVPQRFETGGLPSLGYAGRVILPVRVTAADPSRPVRLVLEAAFGVCSDLCLLEEGTAALDLPPGEARPTGDWPTLALAESLVPGDAAEARLDVRAAGAGDGLRLTVTGPGADGIADVIVVEAGEGARIYGVPVRLSAAAGESVWNVPVIGRGGPPPAGAALDVTLAAGGGGGHALAVRVGPHS